MNSKPPRAPLGLTDDQRFWRFVDIPCETCHSGSCWTWLGQRVNGYGQFRVRSPRAMVTASRYAWSVTHGEIPVGMFVCHRCDNPPCVRPSHLFLGDNKANMQDAVRKYRMHFGERSGLSRLTEPTVRAIMAEPGPVKAVAAKFGVHRMTVERIRTGRTWPHITRKQP
jgi:hypothetical protein